MGRTVVVEPQIIIIAAVLGLVPAVIADRKGHSFIVYWGLGALLFIVALPMALMLKPNARVLTRRGEARKCPSCAELIQQEARVCRYCGRDVPPVDGTTRRRMRDDPWYVTMSLWKVAAIVACPSAIVVFLLTRAAGYWGG